MSSIPGYTLESFVMWNADLIVDGDGSANTSLAIAEAVGIPTRRRCISAADFRRIIELFEPYREYVENNLLEFDEHTQSWRDYAGYAFDAIPKEVFASAEGLLNA